MQRIIDIAPDMKPLFLGLAGLLASVSLDAFNEAKEPIYECFKYLAVIVPTVFTIRRWVQVYRKNKK